MNNEVLKEEGKWADWVEAAVLAVLVHVEGEGCECYKVEIEGRIVKQWLMM
jgi:hypothetical protein